MRRFARQFARQNGPVFKSRPKSQKVDLGPTKKESYDEFVNRLHEHAKKEHSEFLANVKNNQSSVPSGEENFDYEQVANTAQQKVQHSEQVEAPQPEYMTLQMTQEKLDEYLVEKKPLNGFQYQSHTRGADGSFGVVFAKEVQRKDSSGMNDNLLKLLAKNIPLEKLETLLSPDIIERMKGFGEIGKEYTVRHREFDGAALDERDRVAKEKIMGREKEYLKSLGRTLKILKKKKETESLDEQDGDNEIDQLSEKEKGLLSNEYEDLDKMNELLEFCNMSKGVARVPREIEDKVVELLKTMPKKTIMQATKELSARFRVRTGGFGHKYSFVTPDKKNDLRRDHLEFMKGGKPTKSGGTREPSILYGAKESLAYVVHRLPSIYGVLHKIMSEVKKRKPTWKPKEMLDFGTGPGTSIYTSNIFFPSIESIMAVEPSSEMMNIAEKLMKPSTAKKVVWRRFLNENQSKQYDLVCASYVLNELSTPSDRHRILRSLFRMTKGILILVEPGTPLGFDLIRDARRILLEDKDSTIVAPCPHDSTCPMGEKSWCHFVVRSERLPFQKIYNQEMKLPYGDEKFSYLVIERRGAIKDVSPMLKKARQYSRVLYTPKQNSGHTIMDLCTKSGTYKQRHYVTRKEKKAYRLSRNLFWGDLYPF